MRTKAIISSVLALICSGCGAAAKQSGYEGAYSAQVETVGGGGGGAETRDALAEEPAYVEDDAAFFDEAESEEATAAPAPSAPAKKKASPSSYDKKNETSRQSSNKEDSRRQHVDRGGEEGAKSRELPEPMVVYTGFLHLRVSRLLEAVDEITGITEERGGYVESLTSDVIVVRVPAGDFEEVMDTFAAVGDLLQRRIQAMDVTEQFTDIGARLAVAREARERLLVLLERTVDVEERLRILEEIKRLSEQIESMESTLSTLRNLVDYFTITIELEPVLEQSGSEIHRSPFSWVRDLSSHKITIREGLGEFEMDLPADFVLFDKEDVYRAQAADTTVIRGGVVDNEPLGDPEFWSEAVHHEMDGRDEELIEHEVAGEIRYRVYKDASVEPRYYLVGVTTREDDLYVVEVFYPSEESFEDHHDAIVESLATFRVY
ncbi:MAG: DUF4349 domain-containing protein [Polyangia bacterium]